MTLRLVSSIKINPTFLIEEKKLSSQNFTEFSPKEFLFLLEPSFIDATIIIRSGCRNSQTIKTRPDICCLEREFLKYIYNASISMGELEPLRKEVFAKNKQGVELLTKYQTSKVLLDNLEFLENIKADAREKV